MEVYSITEPIRGPKIREKKSIFVATAVPIQSMEDVESVLEDIRKDLKKATHHAFAYRYVSDGEIYADCHDDGEVSGTAGEPILNILGHYNVVNILMVVTRFYGRIHLGPAGLIRQYAGAAKDLLDHVNLVELHI